MQEIIDEPYYQSLAWSSILPLVLIAAIFGIIFTWLSDKIFGDTN